jgi:phosphoribosylglycinamide formyltransferase-1
MRAEVGDVSTNHARPFPLGRTARLAVLASGRGSNLASLLAAFPPAIEPGAGDRSNLGSIGVVISNKRDAPALSRARQAGVSAVHVPWDAHHPRDAFEAEVARVLDAAAIDLVCLAGFMRLLSPAFTARYAGRLLNIHPSLLPDFRGLHAQRQALAAGVSEAGCTVHFVDAGVDTGQVILQKRVPVLPDDTEESLSQRILEVEHLAYPEAVTAVLSGWRP